ISRTVSKSWMPSEVERPDVPVAVISVNSVKEGCLMRRRTFLETMMAGAAVPATLSAAAASADDAIGDELKRPAETKRGDMRYRRLGRTGEDVSVIGLGGHHIGRQKEERESIGIIRAAIDGGITFLDNCWDYHDGGSEIRMGQALQDGYRKN